jgi:hypothetical protein
MQNTSVNENKNLPQTNCKADKNLNKTPQWNIQKEFELDIQKLKIEMGRGEK